MLQKMRAACDLPTYPYPWDGLETDLARARQSLWLLGYGSLLNSASAAQTLTTDVREPAIAFGAQRIFNYEMTGRTLRYGPPETPHARGLLNVNVTGRFDDMVNGLIIKTPPSDIPALRGREVGYELVAVACMYWHRREDPPFLAYTLQRPENAQDGDMAESLEPHRMYYQVCRDGAAELGDDFLHFWLSTTYLADGQTLVQRWEGRQDR